MAWSWLALPSLIAECRGWVCRVFSEGVVLQTKVAWRLLADKDFAQLIRRSSFHSRNGRVDQPLHVTVLPAPEETLSGQDVSRGAAEGTLQCP